MSKELEALEKNKNALKNIIAQSRCSYGYSLKEVDNNSFIVEQALKQLSAYRKIEKELGIGLITLFKAFNEIVFRDGNVINFSHRIILIKNHYGWCIEPLEMRLQNKQLLLLLKDYGKTWALTREELEK